MSEPLDPELEAYFKRREIELEADRPAMLDMAIEQWFAVPEEDRDAVRSLIVKARMKRSEKLMELVDPTPEQADAALKGTTAMDAAHAILCYLRANTVPRSNT